MSGCGSCMGTGCASCDPSEFPPIPDNHWHAETRRRRRLEDEQARKKLEHDLLARARASTKDSNHLTFYGTDKAIVAAMLERAVKK